MRTPRQLVAIMNARKRSAAKNSKAKERIVANALKFNIRLILTALLFSNSYMSTGQSNGIQISAGLNRLDYLIGVGYSCQSNDFQIEGSIEMGASSTFKQGRINPRLGVGLAYLPIQKANIYFGPSLGYAYSFLQVNKVNHSYHHWHEFLFGYLFEYGDKWRITHKGMVSLMNERFKSQLTTNSVNYTNVGFYAQIGVKYCW